METNNNTNPAQESKKKRIKKAVLISLGVVGATVGGIFGWQKWKENRNAKKNAFNDDNNASVVNTPTSHVPSSGSSSYKPSTSTTPVRKDEFPLKKGSKGTRVKEMQEALLYKHGKLILPKYGADSDFGSELEAALTKAGYATQIDESLYNIIIKSGAPDAKSTATRLFNAVEKKSYQSILDTVKTIRNIKDYKAVNEEFKKLTPWPIPPIQVVTAAIAPFLANTQREKMRLEFNRIGLNFDGKYWTLSGIETGQLLITTEPTELIDLKHQVKVKVPANMVIGYRLQEKNGLTLFKTIEKNKKLIVKSTTVKNYERN